MPTAPRPQRALAGRAVGRLCAPPWPATPRTAGSGAPTCSGGSRASVVGLPTLQGWDLRGGPRVTPISECSKLLARPPSSSRAARFGVGDRGARDSQAAPVPAERLCPGDQLYSNCASACPPSCSAGDEGAEGSCREECVSGCECPPRLYPDCILCVPAARCPCFQRRRRHAPGDTVRQWCNPWWVRGPCRSSCCG